MVSPSVIPSAKKSTSAMLRIRCHTRADVGGALNLWR